MNKLLRGCFKESLVATRNNAYSVKKQICTSSVKSDIQLWLVPFTPPIGASNALTNRPLTRFLVSALAFLDSYRICLSYLGIIWDNEKHRIGISCGKKKRDQITYLLVFFFSLYRCIAVPLFFARSSKSALVIAGVTLSHLIKIDWSVNWISFEPPKHLGLFKHEPDDCFENGKLLSMLQAFG